MTAARQTRTRCSSGWFGGRAATLAAARRLQARRPRPAPISRERGARRAAASWPQTARRDAPPLRTSWPAAFDLSPFLRDCARRDAADAGPPCSISADRAAARADLLDASRGAWLRPDDVAEAELMTALRRAKREAHCPDRARRSRRRLRRREVTRAPSDRPRRRRGRRGRRLPPARGARRRQARRSPTRREPRRGLRLDHPRHGQARRAASSTTPPTST